MNAKEKKWLIKEFKEIKEVLAIQGTQLTTLETKWNMIGKFVLIVSGGITVFVSLISIFYRR